MAHTATDENQRRDEVRKESSHRTQEGSVITEMAVVLMALVMLCGLAFDLGMLFLAYQATQNAARQAARVAVTLPALSANDPRVQAEGLTILSQGTIGAFALDPLVSNTAPGGSLGFTNISTGAACDRWITVTVQTRVRFFFAFALDVLDRPLARSVSMRYQVQPLCMI